MKGHQGVSTSKKNLIVVETFGALRQELTTDFTAHVFTEALRYTTMSNGKLRPNGLNYAGKLARLHINTVGYEADPKKRAKALKVIDARGLRYLLMAEEGIMTPVSLCNHLTTGANAVFVDNEDGLNERENFPLMEFCLDSLARRKEGFRAVFLYAFGPSVLNLLKRYRTQLIGTELMNRANHQGTLYMVSRRDDEEVLKVLRDETEDRCGHLIRFKGRKPKSITPEDLKRAGRLLTYALAVPRE